MSVVDVAALLAEAEREALLLDGARQAEAALRVLEAGDQPEAKVSDAEVARARLRLAELLRRVRPLDALEMLDECPTGLPDEPRVRIHALLDQRHFAGARRLGAAAESTAAERPPALQVALARITYLQDPAAGLARLDATVAAGLPNEALAEALNLRGRWRAEAGDLAGGQEDFLRLKELASQCRAPLTAGLAALYEDLYERLAEVPAAAQGAAGLARALCDELTGDLKASPRRLGPIPPYLHALMVRFGPTNPQPATFAVAVLQIAGLQEAAGQLTEAYATLLYGASLTRRTFGPLVARSIEARRRSLLQRVGPRRAREIEQAEASRAQRFLEALRPPGGSA